MTDVTVSNNVQVTAVILDDNDSDLDLVSPLGSDDFIVEKMTPEALLEDTVDSVLSKLSDVDAPLLLADYRLDVPEDVRFRGGSVALAVKDARPAIPVALITSDANMHAFLDARPSAKAAFDWTLLKEDFVEKGMIPRIREQLRSLAGGHAWLHRLGESPRGGDESTGGGLLRESVGSRDQDIAEVGAWLGAQKEKTPAEFATWMLGEFFAAPSPLVDRSEAAAILGVTGKSFDEMQSIADIEAARYAGLFAGLKSRWWRTPILRLAEAAERSGSGVRADGFAVMELVTKTPEEATCPWCAGPVTRSCVSCQRGCDEAHALPLATKVPPWSMPLVICFECVAAGRDKDGDYHLDPGLSELAHEIRTGKLAPRTS